MPVVPIRSGARQSRSRQLPKPEFALMAAAQMSQEGKFGPAADPGPNAAMQSIQPPGSTVA